jgi:hypothetical protein
MPAAGQLVPQSGTYSHPHDGPCLMVMTVASQLMADDTTDNTAYQRATHGIAAAVAIGPDPYLLIPADLSLNPNPLALNNGVNVHHLGVIVAVMVTLVTRFTPVITVSGIGLGHGRQQPDGD